jgi:BolA protein
VTNDRVSRIEALLTEAFAPSHLLVKDQSHLHAGHAGARDGRGHFDVTIVAEAFAGQRPLARHRLVYDALGKMMETDIHALRIDARAPKDDI